MNKKIYSKICKIFEDIFDTNKFKLKKTTSAKDISNWDSINNLKLIIVIEKVISDFFKPCICICLGIKNFFAISHFSFSV